MHETAYSLLVSPNVHSKEFICLGWIYRGTAAAVPSLFRHGKPALCGSHPI